jgi:hypothetical protein
MNLDEYEKAESKHYEWDELRFSKEDLLEAFKASRTVKNYKGEWEQTYSNEMTDAKYETFEEWFEQFKK